MVLRFVKQAKEENQSIYMTMNCILMMKITHSNAMTTVVFKILKVIAAQVWKVLKKNTKSVKRLATLFNKFTTLEVVTLLFMWIRVAQVGMKMFTLSIILLLDRMSVV